MSIWQIFAAVGLPATIVSAVVGLMFRRIEKRLEAEERRRVEREKNRRQFEQSEVQTLFAVAALCEANAVALQNGKCNGETHAALDYMKEVKHKQKNFLINNGVDFIFKED